ncbi:MAG: hypothetical protein JXR97_08085 [Planctomycetes bacterium]|nr:hypothetical protein [Planctomycetota bacterium]
MNTEQEMRNEEFPIKSRPLAHTMLARTYFDKLSTNGKGGCDCFGVSLAMTSNSAFSISCSLFTIHGDPSLSSG